MLYSSAIALVLHHTEHVTGKMNEETEAKMKVMRCGISDATPTTSLQKRVRRYYLVGTIWKNMNLTYKIFKYSRHISQTVVDKSAVESFKVSVIIIIVILVVIEVVVVVVNVSVIYIHYHRRCNLHRQCLSIS